MADSGYATTSVTMDGSLPDRSQTASWDWENVYELTPDVPMIPPHPQTSSHENVGVGIGYGFVDFHCSVCYCYWH